MSAVKIDYNTLSANPDSLYDKIETAFGNGSDALGVIVIESQSPSARWA
jgi:hypothetical protein